MKEQDKDRINRLKARKREEMREKIAIITGCFAYNKPWCSLNESQQKVCLEIANQILALFQEEISKLKPLNELELSLLLESRQEVPNERDNVVTQASLTKFQEDLLKTLEGK